MGSPETAPSGGLVAIGNIRPAVVAATVSVPKVATLADIPTRAADSDAAFRAVDEDLLVVAVLHQSGFHNEAVPLSKDSHCLKSTGVYPIA